MHDRSMAPPPKQCFLDEVPFAVRLAQTIAWCASRADVAHAHHSLRDERLRPPILARDRKDTVLEVADARARELELDETTPAAAERSGRLLVYFPESSLRCGGAEVASRGYFDADNTPPWDTWVALGYDASRDPQSGESLYLVAWVPPSMMSLVTAGIEANPEECIRWVSDIPWLADAPWAR